MSDWHYLLNNKQKGPISESELKSNFAASKLPADTLVWKEGMENWAKAEETSVFSGQAATAPPSLPPSLVARDTGIATGSPEIAVVCAGCKSTNVVAGHKTPLCEPCRTALIKRPLPIWLRITIGLVVLTMIYSATHLPRELNAALALDRGETADARQDYATAENEYKRALAIYPASNNVMGDLAVAAYHSGDKQTAEQYEQILAATARTSDDAKLDLVKVYSQTGRLPNK